MHTAVREVEEFVSAGGWDQAPQLFALVSTADLLTRQPGLAGEGVDPDVMLTPVAQGQLPAEDLDVTLAGIVWPDTVAGCAVVQEIVVLPPAAEERLDSMTDDVAALRKAAAEHPHRREVRVVAAVMRNGSVACTLRIRGDKDQSDEVVDGPELMPNLTRALLGTLQP
ncbi:MAG: hypothetical protein JO285_04445 [Kutzneria sp.]|nr:hypothetical protein [Kutzneria sp.]